MSRAAAQSNLQISVDLKDFTCPISMSLFFNPAQAAPCGHVFESQSIQGFVGKNCPCCRQDIVILSSPSPFLHNALNNVLTQNSELYNEVYFDLTDFEKIFKQENGLKTPIGERYITLLENAANHLNEAISMLTGTIAGRDLLRQKLRIDAPSGKFFFGKAEISAESLQIQVNGKSIREWLSMTTAMELMQEEEQKVRQAMDVEAQTTYRQLQTQFSRARLFLLRGAEGASSAESDDRVSAELQPLLKAAFGADLDGVKRIIEETRSEDRGALLSTLASANYPETEIHVDTAFKVALATGDEEMAVEIAQHLDPAEIARQFKNVFGPDYAAFLKQQEKETEALFESLEAAFSHAAETEVQNALNHVPNTASVLQQKIAEFKIKLEEYVNKTRPLHNDFILAKAFEIYDRNWSPWSGGQLCLFSQQVIGLIQASTLKTSTKRSMDIAEGIYNRAENIDKHLPARRSLLLAGSTTDIRSVVDLGSRCCIDIFDAEADCLASRPLYKNCVGQTNQLWKTYAAIEVTPVSHAPRLLGDVR